MKTVNSNKISWTFKKNTLHFIIDRGCCDTKPFLITLTSKHFEQENTLNKYAINIQHNNTSFLAIAYYITA